MSCYPEVVLRRFASGELDEPGMSEVLRHAETCPRCRHALHVAERNVAKQLLVLADRKDWFPPRPRSLKARVFSAVADDQDCRTRQALARKRHWRLAQALAAAAVLLLILGARYLGEPRWNGCLESTRGTLLLSPSGETFSAIDRVENLPPGGLIMVPAGSAADLVFEDGTSIELADSALAVIGGLNGGPRLSVARGIVRIRATPEEGIVVRVGDRELLVQGACDFEVRCTSPADALASARAWADRPRSGLLAGILPAAVAANGSPGTSFFVGVRAVTGTVALPDDKVLATAGQELRSLDGSGWSAAVLSITPEILDSECLSKRELQAIPALLRRDADAVLSLESAALDHSAAPWKRGLATWLLGELGDPRAVATLTRLLRTERNVPVMVRAAAVRSLSSLGALDPVLVSLVDAEPAVAEAAIMSLPDGSGERLKAIAASAGHPDWQRALAARRADEMGVSPGIPTLLALLESKDQDVTAQAHRLVDRIRSEDGDRILLDLARNGTDVERTRAMKSLIWRDGRKAVPLALEGARQTAIPGLRDASLRLLARKASGRFDEFIDGALDDSDEKIRTAVLWGLWKIGQFDEAPIEEHRDSLRRIALDAGGRPTSRAMALCLLDEPHLTRQVLGANPDSSLLRGVLQYVPPERLPVECIDLIRRATRHPRADIRLRAIQALSMLSPAEAIELIEEKLRDPSDDPK